MKIIINIILMLSFFLLAGCVENSATTFKVSFNATIEQAPHIETLVVEEGKYVSEPDYVDSVIRNNKTYQFDGWYHNGVQFDFDNEITSDIELEARWKIVENFPGLLVNYLEDEYGLVDAIIYIGKIKEQLETIFNNHAYFNVLTVYSLEIETQLYGESVDYEEIYILGGEIEANIYKYFHILPKPVELGKYYFIIDVNRDEWEYDHPVGISHIFGHSVIELFSYDPTKPINEQDEDVLAIIQPYLDAIDEYNESQS